MVENLPAMQETLFMIPGLRRAPGEKCCNSLQYFSLGNSMDRGASRLQFIGPQKSQTKQQQQQQLQQQQ